MAYDDDSKDYGMLDPEPAEEVDEDALEDEDDDDFLDRTAEQEERDWI